MAFNFFFRLFLEWEEMYGSDVRQRKYRQLDPLLFLLAEIICNNMHPSLSPSSPISIRRNVTRNKWRATERLKCNSTIGAHRDQKFISCSKDVSKTITTQRILGGLTAASSLSLALARSSKFNLVYVQHAAYAAQRIWRFIDLNAKFTCPPSSMRRLHRCLHTLKLLWLPPSPLFRIVFNYRLSALLAIRDICPIRLAFNDEHSITIPSVWSANMRKRRRRPECARELNENKNADAFRTIRWMFIAAAANAISLLPAYCHLPDLNFMEYSPFGKSGMCVCVHHCLWNRKMDFVC